MPITSLKALITRPERSRPKAQVGRQRSLWDDDFMWRIAALARICKAKHIVLRETQAFTTMDVLVVQCGDAATIKLRASLDEPHKIAAVAHALGHIALGHTSSDSQSASCRWDPRIAAPVEVIPEDIAGERADTTLQESDVDIKAVARSREEWQAAVWAAHALVRPEIFAGHVDQLRAEHIDPETACKVAQVRTGNDLNIPSEVVERWLTHYDWQFPEPPAAWLEHDRKTYAGFGEQASTTSAGSAAVRGNIVAEEM